MKNNFVRGISLYPGLSDCTAEENEKLQKYGADPVKALDRIRHSYETAMADTDNRLLTQTNARTTTRSKKGLTQEEAKKMLEAETPKTADKK